MDYAVFRVTNTNKRIPIALFDTYQEAMDMIKRLQIEENYFYIYEILYESKDKKSSSITSIGKSI